MCYTEEDTEARPPHIIYIYIYTYMACGFHSIVSILCRPSVTQNGHHGAHSRAMNDHMYSYEERLHSRHLMHAPQASTGPSLVPGHGIVPTHRSQSQREALDLHRL